MPKNLTEFNWDLSIIAARGVCDNEQFGDPYNLYTCKLPCVNADVTSPYQAPLCNKNTSAKQPCDCLKGECSTGLGDVSEDVPSTPHPHGYTDGCLASANCFKAGPKCFAAQSIIGFSPYATPAKNRDKGDPEFINIPTLTELVYDYAPSTNYHQSYESTTNPPTGQPEDHYVYPRLQYGQSWKIIWVPDESGTFLKQTIESNNVRGYYTLWNVDVQKYLCAKPIKEDYKRLNAYDKNCLNARSFYIEDGGKTVPDYLKSSFNETYYEPDDLQLYFCDREDDDNVRYCQNNGHNEGDNCPLAWHIHKARQLSASDVEHELIGSMRDIFNNHRSLDYIDVKIIKYHSKKNFGAPYERDYRLMYAWHDNAASFTCKKFDTCVLDEDDGMCSYQGTDYIRCPIYDSRFDHTQASLCVKPELFDKQLTEGVNMIYFDDIFRLYNHYRLFVSDKVNPSTTRSN